MLGKLLKHDLKWIYKVVSVFYALSLFFSVIGRCLGEIKNSVIFFVVSQIALGFAVSMMVSSLINCIMRLWARFVINIYKDESYLTHTLPVEKKTIYTSKVISAFISIFITVIFILLCLFICYYSQENIDMIKKLLELAATTYNTTVIHLLLLIASVIFLEIMFIVLIGYVGIILGHKSNDKKMLKTIVYGFAIYMAMQVITLIVICMLGLVNSNVMNLIKTTEIISIDAIKLLMYFAIGVYAIYVTFLYILGKKQLEKGVNIQ